MKRDGAIDYVELATRDMAATQQFYTEVFGWRFVEYGPDYASFTEAGLDGGFDASAEARARLPGEGAPACGPLVVVYAADLEAVAQRVRAAGGVITQPIFSFPGGRRFHFRDPGGAELAVWSEVGA